MILLAIHPIKNEEIIVISEAARRFKVLKSTPRLDKSRQGASFSSALAYHADHLLI
jgi:hypothetical protein